MNGLPRGLLLAAGVVLALAGMLLAWNMTTVGVFNDDACYILEARHLWYGTDYGPLTHLPGQALVLLPAVVLFPHTPDAPRVEGLLITLGAVVAWGRLASTYVDTITASLVAACFACNRVGWVTGTTAMSDATFAALIPLIFMLHRRRTHPVLVGLALGLAILCRAPAVLLALVLLGDEALQRNGRRLLGLGAGLLATAVMAGLLFDVSSIFGEYARDQGQLMASTSLTAYLAAWSPAMEAALGFFAPGLWWIAALAFPLSLVGVRKAPVLGGFEVLYCALFVGWAYVEPRFIWAIWPLVLMLAVLPWPQRAGQVALGALLLLNLAQLPALAADGRQATAMARSRWASLDWLGEHAAGQTVLAPLHYFAMVRTGLLAVGQRPGDVGNLVAQALETGATYIYVDPSLGAATQVTRDTAPARLDLWLDRSTAVQKVYQTPWDRVYRVVAPKGRYLAACRHWQVGQRLGDGDELRQALQQYPDLPGARLALARLAPRADSEALLQVEVRQYPVDTPAVLLLASEWQADGRSGEATRLLQESIERARQEGRDEDAARLQTLLLPAP